ncbi:MAG TPA: geranylgeranylglyceryl/heptaprenylglyceryl phosphate synthase [Williamwhitmania sp.]|nr:geranylgeranylglyceryl/heptaprenylglyceryl phosphate synthase [Williamwhitmania sp.]
MKVFHQIAEKTGRQPQIALLIDPDKHTPTSAAAAAAVATAAGVDFIMVGGSYVSADANDVVSAIKESTQLAVVLFPGSPLQLSASADAIFLLSLISGRNPEYLIGNHVLAAGYIKKLGVEVIPVGYILVDGGVVSSVQYVSNTMPIPASKPDLVVATAMAGEMLGLKMIYLEAGSGATQPVPAEVIAATRSSVSIPIIVGGGLRSNESVTAALKAGADVVVVGTAVEDDLNTVGRLVSLVKNFRR